MMSSPEVHNIIARWNKESNIKSNIGLKIERIQDKDFRPIGYIYTIYTHKPGWLIGKGGCLINKYSKELEDYTKKWYPTAKTTVNIVELTDIIGEDEIDIDAYYASLMKHVLGDE